MFEQKGRCRLGFYEHVKRGKKLGKVYKPSFKWKEYSLATEKIEELNRELELLERLDMMKNRQENCRRKIEEYLKIIADAKNNWYCNAEEVIAKLTLILRVERVEEPKSKMTSEESIIDMKKKRISRWIR
jgi:hypothetical protein